MLADMSAILPNGQRWAVINDDNADVFRILADRVVDHVITDPPFNDRTSTNARTNKNSDDAGKAHQFITFGGIDPAKVAPEMLRVAKRWVLAFCAMEQLGEYAATAGRSWVRAGVWVKPDGAPQFTGDRPAQACEGVAIMHRPGKKRWNDGGARGFWLESVVQDRSEYGHPTPKPLPLMLRLIEQFTDPGDTVLDPFCGSGTTGVACLRLGRSFVGVERSSEYAEVARKRLAAESQGLTLRDARAGQLSLLEAAK